MSQQYHSMFTQPGELSVRMHMQAHLVSVSCDSTDGQQGAVTLKDTLIHLG